MYYVLYAIAGIFAAYGIPYFIKGITGQQQATPLGNSSAVVNVVWGSASFVIAWAAWHYAGLHRSLDHTVRYELVFVVAAFVVAVMLANSLSQKSGK